MKENEVSGMVGKRETKVMTKSRELACALALSILSIVLFCLLRVPECEYVLIEIFKIENGKAPLLDFYLLAFAMGICGVFGWGKIIIDALRK